MALFRSVLCALDGSSLAPRVLRHAVGFAALADARLSILTATSGDLRRVEAELTANLHALVPKVPTVMSAKVRAVQIALGLPVDEILDAAHDHDLIVAGTHSMSGLSRWLLGSTSAALLEQTTRPTLLVPPGEIEIVVLGPNGARLTPGTVLAAVDPAEAQVTHLVVASRLANMASQPLALVTVAAPGVNDEQATEAVEALVRRAGAEVTATRTLVRRGRVADEIDHAAVAEHAGLVVMGLRSVERGTPGSIATAVLKQKDAVVLAVPPGWQPA